MQRDSCDAQLSRAATPFPTVLLTTCGIAYIPQLVHFLLTFPVTEAHDFLAARGSTNALGDVLHGGGLP
jgi:hypothetical protein